MNTNSAKYSCKMCGSCCYQDIPLTIYDIHRIAGERGIDDGEVFEQCVGEKTSPRVNIFAMKKKEDGSCIFLDEDHKCSIYPFKPRVCSFYPCPDILKKDKELWAKLYLGSSPFEIFWEHSMAENHTKKYIQRFGTRWNEDGYFEILDELKRYIIVEEGENLVVASDVNGLPMEIKYNCLKCEVASECSMETEITLKDILRIADKTRTSIENVFRKAVSKRPHLYTGGMKLKRIKAVYRCVYFSKEDKGHCVIYPFRPTFCKLEPCRLRVGDEETWKRFFFAAGDIEDQWELEVSAAITRRYVREMGVKYNRMGFGRYIEEINTMMKNEELKQEFVRNIRQYRYDRIPIEPVP